MPAMVLRDPSHIEALGRRLAGRKLPLTVSWVTGAARSDAANRLSQRWYTDVARQLGDQSHEDVRAECKLRFGVPILRSENEAFRHSWDEGIGALSYERQQAAIKAFDLPVTRLMSARQMSAFMDEMKRFWTGHGVRLTDPEQLKWEEEFE